MLERIVVADDASASGERGAWTCSMCGFRGFWRGGPHCMEVPSRFAHEGHDYPACALFRGGRCTCDEQDAASVAAPPGPGLVPNPAHRPSEEGTYACTCLQYPHASWCGPWMRHLDGVAPCDGGKQG